MRFESASSGSQPPQTPDESDSHQYNAVEIVDEALAAAPFAPPLLQDIPFSRPNRPAHHPRRGITYRPTTVREFDPHGILPLELALEFAREERRRMNKWAPASDIAMSSPSNHGARSSNTSTVPTPKVAPRPLVRDLTPTTDRRPIITIAQPAPERNHPPAQPASPKPAPPPFPPSRFPLY